MTQVLGVLAGTFGVVMGASPLLQAFRSHRRRSASDVSLAFLGVLIGGGSAWLAYGIALGNLPMITANGVGVLSSATALVVTARWRTRRRTGHSQAQVAGEAPPQTSPRRDALP